MTGPAAPEPRERFLRAIAERIGAERIAAIHLFPALRAGVRESAVAVIAAEADAMYAQGELPPPVGDTTAESEHGAAGEGEGGGTPAGIAVAEPDDAGGAEESPSTTVPEAGASDADGSTALGPPPDVHDTAADAEPPHPGAAEDIDSETEGRPPRLVVYRAIYRWTRKGPDRGKWEVDITAEADAPLQAVSDVVRGVQRRAGEDGEPEFITPEALRVAISDRPWAAAM